MNQPQLPFINLGSATTTSGIEVPILGYTVWWSLSGIRVDHADLATALEDAGFEAYVPNPPTFRKSLRRALEAWIREKREGTGFEGMDDDGDDHRSDTLIRTINTPRSKWMLFALVAENQDVQALGLEYATTLRILLDKEQGGMVVTAQARGISADISAMLGTAGGEVTAAEVEARRVAGELLPFWQVYRTLHVSADLSRMVRDIVCGDMIQRPTRKKEERDDAQQRPGLGAVTARTGGGLYFVPAGAGEALGRLRDLLENLPTDGRHEPYFVIQPVLDETHAKGHLARAVHAGFLDEISTMQTDLERLAASKNPTEDSVAARLVAYRESIAKLDTYADLLGMQRDAITDGLETLRHRARQLILADSDD